MKRTLVLAVFAIFLLSASLSFASETIEGVQCNAQINDKEGCVGPAPFDIMVCKSPTWTPTQVNGENGFTTAADCNAKCKSAYGDNCITSSPQTTSNYEATVTIIPATPTAGQQFNIKFTLTSSVSSDTTIEMEINEFQTVPCSGNTCTAQVSPLPAGPYEIRAFINGSSLLPVSLSQDSFTVGGSNAGTGGSCCAIPSGDRYTYQRGITEEQCRAQSGTFSQSGCNALELSVCREFCGNKLSSQGSCVPVAADETKTFSQVCYNGNCKCGTVDSTLQKQQEACSDFCYTSSSYSGFATAQYTQQAMMIPISECTRSPEAFFSGFQLVVAAGGTASGGQSTTIRGPCGNVGQNQCSSNERCCCAYTRINTGSVTTPTTPATIPGTQGTLRWDPTDAIKNPPQKTANQRQCDAAVNATITASFGTAQMTQGAGGQAQMTGLRMVQAGDPITIVGKVTKLADQCDGYKYQCRAQKEVNCKVDSGFFKTTLDYDKCPADLPDQIHEEGQKSVTNTKRIWGIVETVGSVADCIWGTKIGCTTIASGVNTVVSASCGKQEVDQLTTMALQMVMRESMKGSTGSTSGSHSIDFVDSEEDCKNKGVWCAAQSKCYLPDAPCGNVVGNVDPTYTYEKCMEQMNDPAACADRPHETTTTYTNPPYTYEECLDDTGDKSYCDSVFGIATEPLPTTVAATANPTFKVNGEPVYTAPSEPKQGAPVTGHISQIVASLIPVVANAIGTQFTACPSVEDVVGCFSVCGKSYDSRIAAAPTCERGGPVVGYQDASYFCGLGDCGGFEGKRVSIKVYGPDGTLAVDDTATAGANGEFSYTFNSPAGDGDFTVLATVPKE